MSKKEDLELLKDEFERLEDEFERLKSDFIERNAAFAKATKQLKFENRKSLEERVRICSLRNQALTSYNLLSDFVITPKFQNESVSKVQ